MYDMSYYEDFEVNQKKRYGNYTVTREEIIEFAKKWDPQPFHIDEVAAKNSIFGGLCASSAHIYSIATLMTQDRPQPIALLAGLGMRDVKLITPLRPDDTVFIEGTILEKRLSATKPDRGIITARSRLINQHGEVVMEQIGSMLIRSSGSESTA